MNKFTFELVSPERVLVSECSEHVILPGIAGELGVLYGHLPCVVMLKPGIVSMLLGGSISGRFYIRGGLADVRPNDTTVLAEYALNIQNVSKEIFTKELSLAEHALAKASDEEAYFSAQSSLDALRSVNL
ncbi:MAG: ATP synthase F1 subunit epsilon [Hyphomicrobiaceae bacterium]|nr:ATP synthase F1 subunit epsilon [Hyphomicrobiaceae bacterium]